MKSGTALGVPALIRSTIGPLDNCLSREDQSNWLSPVWRSAHVNMGARAVMMRLSVPEPAIAECPDGVTVLGNVQSSPLAVRAIVADPAGAELVPVVPD